MKLDVTTAIRTPGQEYAFDGQQAIAPMDVSGDSVTFDDACVKGTFQALDDGSVTVDGSVCAVAHGRCANCLSPASVRVENSFRETFVRNGDPEDDEIFSYTGCMVDLEKLVMSYVVLALPMRFLCREDCPGLAHDVEKDPDVCLCQEGDDVHTQRPFAALQLLLEEKNGSSAR